MVVNRILGYLDSLKWVLNAGEKTKYNGELIYILLSMLCKSTYLELIFL